MDDDQVGRAIDEIERSLAIDDPGFVRRIHTMRRHEIVHAVAVFVLLSAGVVLLTAGLATSAVLPWSLGLASLVLAVLVDGLCQRRWR